MRQRRLQREESRGDRSADHARIVVSGGQ